MKFYDPVCFYVPRHLELANKAKVPLDEVEAQHAPALCELLIKMTRQLPRNHLDKLPARVRGAVERHRELLKAEPELRESWGEFLRPVLHGTGWTTLFWTTVRDTLVAWERWRDTWSCDCAIVIKRACKGKRACRGGDSDSEDSEDSDDLDDSENSENSDDSDDLEGEENEDNDDENEGMEEEEEEEGSEDIVSEYESSGEEHSEDEFSEDELPEHELSEDSWDEPDEDPWSDDYFAVS